LMAKTADELYTSLRAVKGAIRADEMPGTMASLREVEKQVGKWKSLEPAKDLLNVIDEFRALVDDGLSFGDITTFRRVVGGLTAKLDKIGGPRLRGANDIFSNLLDDVSRLGRRTQGIRPTDEVFEFSTGAELFEAAPKRMKLEWALQDLDEEVIEKWAKGVAGAGAERKFHAKQALDTLRGLTRKGSSRFDKNFTEALKSELKDLFRFFETANTIEGALVKGPGRLIIAGRAARLGQTIASAAPGALFGLSAGGPVGQAIGTIGALAGVQLPGMMTKVLLTRQGQTLVTRLLRAGEGQLSNRALALIGGFAGQVGARPELRETLFKGATTSLEDIAKQQFQQRFER